MNQNPPTYHYPEWSFSCNTEERLPKFKNWVCNNCPNIASVISSTAYRGGKPTCELPEMKGGCVFNNCKDLLEVRKLLFTKMNKVQYCHIIYIMYLGIDFEEWWCNTTAGKMVLSESGITALKNHFPEYENIWKTEYLISKALTE